MWLMVGNIQGGDTQSLLFDQNRTRQFCHASITLLSESPTGMFSSGNSSLGFQERFLSRVCSLLMDLQILWCVISQGL